jgi:hypothetical protein
LQGRKASLIVAVSFIMVFSFQNEAHAFIDSLIKTGASAMGLIKDANDLYIKMYVLLGELTEVQKKQSDDIDKINNHFKRIDSGLNYRDVLSMADYDTYSKVYDTETKLYDGSQAWEEFSEKHMDMENSNPYYQYQSAIENVSQSTHKVLNPDKSTDQEIIDKAKNIQASIDDARDSSIKKINAYNTAQNTQEAIKTKEAVKEVAAITKKIADDNQKKEEELKKKQEELEKQSKEPDPWKKMRKEVRNKMNAMYWE